MIAPFAIQRKLVRVYLLFDPATTDKSRSDFSGIVIVAVDKDDIWYVLEAEAYKGQPEATIQQIVKWCNLYRPEYISIEDVAAQKLFKPLLQAELEKIHHYPYIVLYKPGTRQSKRARIERLEPRFRQGKIFLKEEQTVLRQQLEDFDPQSEADHEDVLDALAQGVEIIRAPSENDVRSSEVDDDDPMDDDKEDERPVLNGTHCGLGTPRRR